MGTGSRIARSVLDFVVGDAERATERSAASKAAEDLAVRSGARGAQAVDELMARGLPPEALAVKPQAPAIISGRSGSAKATAQDVLAAAAKKKGRPSFVDWRAANPESGTLLDTSNLSAVPNVPQTQMPRFEPPKGPSARITDALSNPDVVQGINDTVERGIQGGGLQWYNTDPLRERMGYVMPSIDVDPAYARMMDITAATSPRARVPDNVRTASYYNYLLQQGLPIPDKPAPGYGSIAQKLHTQNVQDVAERGGWDVFKNPKPASFSTNLQGNQRNVTIDTHNFRLPGILAQDPRFLATSIVPEKGAEPIRPQEMLKSGEATLQDLVARPAMWSAKPNPNEYGYYERWQQDQAAKRGISPAQYQASMWLGGGEDTGLGSAAEPFLHTVEARVKYTADALGMDPDKLLEMYLRGDTPLLAKGGRVNSDLAARP